MNSRSCWQREERLSSTWRVAGWSGVSASRFVSRWIDMRLLSRAGQLSILQGVDWAAIIATNGCMQAKSSVFCGNLASRPLLFGFAQDVRRLASAGQRLSEHYRRTTGFPSFSDWHMALRPQVVITGIGVVSPIGVGHESYWKSLCEQRSGCRRSRLWPIPICRSESARN